MSFIDFWTNENNPILDKNEYLYGPRHIATLAITVLLCIILFMIFRKKDDKVKDKLFYSFAYILLFFEIVSRIVNLIILDDYTITNIVKIILPMHICSVMVLVFICAIFSKKKILLTYSIICGFLATLAFLLYPAVGLNRKYMSFTCIYSTFSHMLGFLTVFLLLTFNRGDFRINKIYQTYLCFITMFSYGALLNYVIFPGSDYMYMRNDPLGLNLSFPYQILYLIVIAIYVLVIYLVNMLIQRLKIKE